MYDDVVAMFLAEPIPPGLAHDPCSLLNSPRSPLSLVGALRSGGPQGSHGPHEVERLVRIADPLARAHLAGVPEPARSPPLLVRLDHGPRDRVRAVVVRSV